MSNQVQKYRLAPQQQRLFSLYGKHQAAMQGVVTIEGAVEQEQLRLAIQQVMERYSILRTTFQEHRGMQFPLQVPMEHAEFEWQEIDLGNLEEEQQQRRIELLATEAREKPWNLEQGPLLRVLLAHLSPRRQTLLLTLLQLGADGTSVENLLHEIASLMNKEHEEQPEEAIQYVQYSEWLREQLGEAHAEAGTLFASQQFAYASNLALAGYQHKKEPPDRWTPPTTQPFSDELIEQIERYALLQGVRAGTIIQACWHMLFWRLTQQPHILVLTLFDGRPYAEFEAGIGAYAHYVPICAHFTSSSSLATLVQKLEELLNYAEELQDILVYKEWEKAREAEKTILSFEEIHDFEPIAQNQHRFTLTQRSGVAEDSGIKLACNWLQRRLELSVPEACFDRTQQQFLLGRLYTLLQDALCNPDLPAKALSILPDEERAYLLTTVNASIRRYPHTHAIHHLIEEQARLNSARPALQFEGQLLTYAELNRQSNQLARYLQSLGVGSEKRVGICMQRGISQIVSLLAILKTGATYVPLDPAYPDEQLHFMIEDSRIAIILTQAHIEGRLRMHKNQILVALDQERVALSRFQQENLPVVVHPGNLAYMIYTSGSTGQPKGVMVEHRNLINYVYALREQLGCEVGWNFMTVTTLAADLGNTSIYCALTSGGCLHIASYEMATNARLFAHYMREQHIDALKIVPTHLQALFSDSEQPVFPNRALILGGEPFPSPLLSYLLSLSGTCTIYNHYGPTETTIGAVVNRICRPSAPAHVEETGSTHFSSRTIALGSPIANTRLYVLNPLLELVPIGVAGELYIGGEGVARGYWGSPALSAERFLPDPFSQQEGARFYRTGDLVCILPGGNVEFLGRYDHQVKVRGYRVELDAIEATLRQCPLVETGAVLLEGKDTQQLLVACVVFCENYKDDEQRLRDYLVARLPDYMVPSKILSLARLPITINGKLDREALASLSLSQKSERGYLAPQTATQQGLAAIWEQVLACKPVGLQSHFFSLGGHSLLMIRLQARIREEFQVEVPIHRFFDAPTLYAQAEIIDVLLSTHSTRQHRTSPLITMQSSGILPPLVCVHPVGGEVSCYLDLIRALGQNQPFYGFQSLGLNDDEKPLTSIEAMARTYLDTLQEHLPQHSPYRLLGWSLGGVIAFEMARQLQQEGKKVAFLGLIDSYSPTLLERDVVLHEADETRTFIVDLLQLLNIPLSMFPQELINLLQTSTSLEQLLALLAEIQRSRFFPQEIGLEDLRRNLRVFIKNRQAFRAYSPLPYEGDIHLYRAEYANALEASSMRGWDQLVQGGIHVERLPSTHYSIVKSPQVELLARYIRKHLN